MTTSLDSTVLIDLINGRSDRVRGLYQQARLNGVEFTISTLVLHEVMFGATLSGRLDAERALLRQLFGDDPIAPFTASDAEEAARLRAELRRMGQTLEGVDILIAGQARAHRWSVATANLKHFERMPNLVVEDWSA